MGSKSLKAIVAKGTGSLPEVDDLPQVVDLADRVSEACLEDKVFRRWGTALGTYRCAAVGIGVVCQNLKCCRSSAFATLRLSSRRRA